MIHRMRLNAAPFDAIASGEKTIELRLFDEKRRAIRVGDEIEFECVGDSDRRVARQVIALHVFRSFDELYAALPLEKCGYTAYEVGAGLARAEDMREYYSSEDEARWGVVGIELGTCEILRGENDN